MCQSYVHIPSVEQGKAIIVTLGVERAGLSHFGIIGCYVCVVRVCACVCVCRNVSRGSMYWRQCVGVSHTRYTRNTCLHMYTPAHVLYACTL